jgi:hypothetical protein
MDDVRWTPAVCDALLLRKIDDGPLQTGMLYSVGGLGEPCGLEQKYLKGFDQDL